jgi:hypothetical protein
VEKLKYMGKRRTNKNAVNKYSTAGYIPGILAKIQDINVCLFVSDIKYKIETHKTAVLYACFYMHGRKTGSITLKEYRGLY